jgi:hypothetical protein
MSTIAGDRSSLTKKSSRPRYAWRVMVLPQPFRCPGLERSDRRPHRRLPRVSAIDRARGYAQDQARSGLTKPASTLRLFRLRTLRSVLEQLPLLHCRRGAGADPCQRRLVCGRGGPVLSCPPPARSLALSPPDLRVGGTTYRLLRRSSWSFQPITTLNVWGLGGSLRST